MTHTSTPPSAPDLTRWTGERASAFIKLLARTGKVAVTARAVGMSRQSAYRLRARSPLFAEYWDVAMEQAAAIAASSRRPRGQRKPVHPLLAKEPRAARAEGDTSRQKG